MEDYQNQDQDRLSLSIKRRVGLSLQMFSISWQLRPRVFLLYMLGAMLEILASLMTIYASARIAALLAQFISTGSAGNIWQWLWIDIGAAAAIALGFAIMAYAQRL